MTNSNNDPDHTYASARDAAEQAERLATQAHAAAFRASVAAAKAREAATRDAGRWALQLDARAREGAARNAAAWAKCATEHANGARVYADAAFAAWNIGANAREAKAAERASKARDETAAMLERARGSAAFAEAGAGE